MFDAVVFAGGGNRCYWQGGFYEAVSERIGQDYAQISRSAIAR